MDNITLRDRLIGSGFMLFSVCTWSGWVVFSRMGVQGSLNAYDIVALRFLVAGIIMLPILIKRGVRMGPWGLGSTLVLTILMGAPYNLMTISGFRFAPAAHSCIIYATTTALACVLGVWWLKEKLSGLKASGLMIALSGIIYLMLMESGDTASPDTWKGHLLFIVAGSFWGLYAVLTRAWRTSALHTTAALSVISMCTYLPVYYFLLPHQIMTGSWGEIAWQGFYQGIMTNTLAMLSYIKGIQKLGAAGTSAFIPLVPVIAALAAIPGLGEIPTVYEWISIGLAGGGVLLASGALEQSVRHSHRIMRSRFAVK